ncbi:MAG: cytochrome c biogenesis protein ResB [Limisphaerales bacterium]
MLASLDHLLDRLISLFTSLRLTVVCLALALLLVFFGTLAQVDLGLYKAQNEYFRSFFIYWGPKGASWKVPVFPGGYLIGGVLLINLFASQFQRFVFTASKIGLWMVHVGLILLLLGQLLTDLLSRESTLHLREGEARNYSETEHEAELAVTDVTDPATDKVVAITQGVLTREKDIRPGDLPFTVRVKQFFANSVVEDRAADAAQPPAATQGIGPRATVKELPRVTEMDRRDVPSAVVEIVAPQGSLGTWLVSEYVEQPQSFTLDNRTYELAMRPHRHYKPYSIQLLKFQHDVYPGTDIPKNFSSRVLLQRPGTGEKREVLIYMNNPLRYAGETYYQANYDLDNRGTILQVVHNPGWLTPYFSCVLVGVGLVVQFTIHLLGFARKRRAA